MAGLFDVVGDYQSQLKAKGIVHKQDFIVWDPHLQRLSEGEHEGTYMQTYMHTDMHIFMCIYNRTYIYLPPGYTLEFGSFILYRILGFTEDE